MGDVTKKATNQLFAETDRRGVPALAAVAFCAAAGYAKGGEPARAPRLIYSALAEKDNDEQLDEAGHRFQKCNRINFLHIW